MGGQRSVSCIFRIYFIVMEEVKNKDTNGHPEGCRCMMCRHGMCGTMGSMCGGMKCCGGGHRFIVFRIIRIFISIVILAIVFSLGVKIGELKAVLNGGYGYSMMGGYGNHSWKGGYGPGMMYQNNWGDPRQLQSTTTPAL
jgi:hypothetical protein